MENGKAPKGIGRGEALALINKRWASKTPGSSEPRSSIRTRNSPYGFNTPRTTSPTYGPRLCVRPSIRDSTTQTGGVYLLRHKQFDALLKR